MRKRGGLTRAMENRAADNTQTNGASAMWNMGSDGLPGLHNAAIAECGLEEAYERDERDNV